MPNPYAQYTKPNPYAVYKTAPAGSKPPTGYGTPGNAPALTYQPGGPNDPAQAARVAAAETRARVNITNPADIAKARAMSVIALDQKRQEMLLAAGEGAPVRVDPNAPSGAAYLKTLPPATSATVKALLAGRMAFPAGAGMRSPYWQQMLAHVAQTDPDFDAVNYNSRNATRREFTAGGSAKNIKALNTAIGHLGQLDSQISGTASHGGFPFATSVNSLVNRYERGSGDPGITNYEQTSGALASELTQVFRGSGGAEADVKRYLSELDPSASEAQKKASIKNIAGLLQSRLNAIGDQYKKGMGTTADPLIMLDQHAQSVMGNLGFGGNGDGGKPPPKYYGGGGPGTPATSPTINVNDPQTGAAIDALVRNGGSLDQVNAVIQSLGPNQAPITPEQFATAQGLVAKGYKGPLSSVQKAEHNPLFNRIASSPAGVGTLAAVDAGLGGMTDELAGAVRAPFSDRSASQLIAEADAKKQAAFKADPKAALAGGFVGNVADIALGGTLLKGTALAASLGRTAPYVGNGVYGAVQGFGQNNNNRLAGAGIGGAAGLIGTGAGELAALPISGALRTETGTAATNATRRMFAAVPKLGKYVDSTPAVYSHALSPAENAAANVFNKVGPDSMKGQLDEAGRLGLPMTIADTSPEARELVAAGVRRSPTAAQHAENVLLPRGRGQIDRLNAAVTRDLGPVSNIPQLSADLTAQAKTAAGPLYDRAYSNPGASSVNLDDLMTRPSMKAGLSRAHNIALEEGRDPTSLGFNLDGEGNVTLNRVPSFHTLDYVKRGLDDTLEPHRNPITGKLELNEATRAINATKNDLLGRIDKVNPDYAAARQAYAGPSQARDALARGQDAFSLNPEELGMQVAGQSPEHLTQMQAGFRSGMMGRANNVRDASNPWEATLGTPNARARIDTLYPGNPGTADLFRAREIESRMARTTNDVLGNSKTAQRGIADQAFMGPSMDAAVDIGSTALTGGVPVLPMAKLGFSGVKNVLKLGADKRAIRKADDLAPMLLNPDAAASSATVDDILARMAARRAFEQKQNFSRPLRMFAAGAGASAPNYY